MVPLVLVFSLVPGVACFLFPWPLLVVVLVSLAGHRTGNQNGFLNLPPGKGFVVPCCHLLTIIMVSVMTLPTWDW